MADEVRGCATRVQQIGAEVRRLADRDLSLGVGQWQSTAAAAFRSRLAEELARIRMIAVELDEAADLLRRHAVAVERVLHEPDGGFR